MTQNAQPPPVVAVLNSNDDLVELLRQVLEHAGLVTVTGHLARRRVDPWLDYWRSKQPLKLPA